MREVILDDGKTIVKSPWLRIDEAAAYCGISRSAFDDRAKEVGLPHGGDERLRLYHTEVLDRWLNGLLAVPFAAPQPKRRQSRIVLTARQDGRRARLAMIDDDDAIVDPVSGKVYR